MKPPLRCLTRSGFIAAIFAAVLAPVFSADLSVAQIKASSEVWPAQLKVSELLDYGPTKKIPAGALVDMYGFEGANVRFQYKGQFYLIEPQVTDLVARANAISSGQAAKEGWHGRVADYLIRRGQLNTASGPTAVKADMFARDSIVVVYYGSVTCTYCSSALPFMKHTLDLLERDHPGRIVRVYSTGDQNTGAASTYARSLGQGWIVAPLGDQYLWSGLLSLPGAATAVNYPALAIYTPEGRVLAAGMRREGKTDEAELVLRKLESVLKSPEKLAMTGGR